MNTGWKMLFNARKEHYFIEGRSLCKKWMRLGSEGCLEYTDNPCKTCLKKLTELRERTLISD